MSDNDDSSDGNDGPSSSKIMSVEKIFRLLEQERFEDIKQLSFENLTAKDENGDTILHRLAVKAGIVHSLKIGADNPSVGIAKCLVTMYPQLASIRNNNGETALCLSTKNPVLGIDMTTALVQAYPKKILSVPDNNGDTPLHNLVGARFYMSPKKFCDMTLYPETVYETQENEATNFEGLKCKMRAHFQHCVVQYESTLPLLIDRGADINAENKDGLTPLICCLQARFSIKLPVDYDKPVEVLVERGAKLRTKGGKHAIAYVKSLRFAQYLLDKDNSEINILNERGWTPLHEVMIQSNSEYLEMIKLMLKHGAIIEEGTHIIDIARKLQFSFDFIEFLLEDSPNYDINTKDEDGATLLLQYGCTVEIIDKLLEMGADISVIDKQGRTAWCNVWSMDDPQAAKKLIDCGVDASTEKEIVSVLIGNYCRTATLYAPNSEQWYDIIKYVLNLPKMRSPIMLKNILTSVKAGVLGRNAFDKKRYFKVLKYIIETHPEIINFVSESPIYCHAASLQFQNTLLDPLGWILAFTGMLYHDNYPIDEYICSLLEVGFQVVRSPKKQVTPLSALLTIPRGTRNCDFRVMNLVKEFIKRGVNVESCVLKYQPEQRELQLLKEKYHLPDALLLAFLNNRVEVVDTLLGNWWAPPLTLLLFNSNMLEQDLVTWYERLEKHQGIPHGTEIFTLVHHKLHETNQDITTAFVNKHVSPLSLCELSKYAVRLSVASHATYPEHSLHDLLQQVVEPTLQFLVLQP